MRIFVTGGTGFIGSRVVRQLCHNGHDVECLLRRTSPTARIDDLSLRRTFGDVADRNSLEQAASGSDAIIHLAGPSSWDDINSPQLDSVVVGGTANLLAVAKPETRFVYVSSVAAIGPANEPTVRDEATPNLPGEGLAYVLAKRRAEALCLRSPRNLVIVSPAETYGAGDTDLITAGNLADMARGPLVLVCDGGSSIGAVDDVAQGIVAALTRGRAGERYFLAGENLTHRRLAEYCLNLSGSVKPIVTVPRLPLRAASWLGRTFHAPLPFNPNVIPYATRYWFVDNQKSQTELGVRFQSAHDTLKPTFRWLKSTGRIQ